jgi:hypothetical protein
MAFMQKNFNSKALVLYFVRLVLYKWSLNVKELIETNVFIYHGNLLYNIIKKKHCGMMVFLLLW